MIEDHRGVVSGSGAVADRSERLAELLDREILPCLERPSRLLGPFDGVFRVAKAAVDVAWIWPSLAEGPDTPQALRSVLESALLPPDILMNLGCAPAPDVEQALAHHRVALFSRPGRAPLASIPTWIVWLSNPVQLLGLLSVFAGAEVDPRSKSRTGGPRVVVTGPGCVGIEDLVGVYGDLVVPTAVAVENLEVLLRDPDALSDRAGVRVGGIAAPEGPVLTRTSDASSRETRTRRDEMDWLLIRGSEGLKRPFVKRIAGRDAAYVDHVFVGSASADLRERHHLIVGERLAEAIGEVFASEAGSVHLDFVIGLPGETVADRVAIARLLGDVLAQAPRGVRQLSARIGIQLPGAEDRSRGINALAPAEVEASIAMIRDALPSRRLRVEIVPSGLAGVVTLLEDGGASVAPVLESVHRGGARRAELECACDAQLWLDALREHGMSLDAARLDVADESKSTGVTSPTGLPRPPWTPPSTESEPETGVSAGTPADVEPERWARWKALVPQQFDQRVEFAKHGLLRFLGPGEVTNLLLRACERAQIPLATTGVVQPRPKLSFGPSLPVGVEGEHEVVDFGLTRKVPDLIERLRPHLPEDLALLAMLFVPGRASNVALSQVAIVEYEADLTTEMWTQTEAQATSRDRLHSWQRRLDAGEPCVDDPTDALNQLRTVQFEDIAADRQRLRFALDLRNPGAKCKPREVLSRGLEEIDVDVRCIPLRRLRLLVIEEDAGRERSVSPMQQVKRAQLRLRAKAKLCA